MTENSLAEPASVESAFGPSVKESEEEAEETAAAVQDETFGGAYWAEKAEFGTAG